MPVPILAGTGGRVQARSRVARPVHGGRRSAARWAHVFEGDRVSGTEIAALIAALAFLLLVGVLMVPILKLRHTVDAATRALTEVADRTGPLLTDANRTLDGMNTAIEQLNTSLDGVNTQLERVDTITGHAQRVSGNVAHLSTIVTGVTANPLVKAAAFSYGVRRTVNTRRGDEPATARKKVVRRVRRGLFRRATAHQATAGTGEGTV